MDFAIIESGGKQYRVSPGDELEIELVAGKPTDTVKFDRVLLVKDGETVKVGKPYLKGVTVVADNLGETKAKKIRVARFRAKSRYRRVVGHRQRLTKVKVHSEKMAGSTSPKTPASKQKTKPA